MDRQSPLVFRGIDIVNSPCTPVRTPRLNLTTVYKTPKSGTRSLTPVYRSTQAAGRNRTPVYRVTSISRNESPVFREASTKREATPDLKSSKRTSGIYFTPVSRFSRKSPCTPVRRLPLSVKLLKESQKRTSTLNSPYACDSVFSPRTPVVTSPCNRKYLMSQEKRLRHAWRLSISDSPGSLRLQERHSTPQRTQEAITVKKLVGSGGFGSVYIGTYKTEKVAIKYMRKQVKNCLAHFENFLAELRVMSLNHEHILRTLAASDPHVYDKEAFLVMEYVDGHNLQQLIDDQDVVFSLDRRVKYGCQISAALDYCHTNNLVHLDIKPANILVNTSDDCKVADFGCCQFLEPDQRANYSSVTGTYAYKAPELLRGERPTVKADIYALGVTLWQMHSREKPYSEQNQHVVIFGVVAYNLRPRDVPESIAIYSDLYRKCWDTSPDVRPSATFVSKNLSEMLTDVTHDNSTITPSICNESTDVL